MNIINAYSLFIWNLLYLLCKIFKRKFVTTQYFCNMGKFRFPTKMLISCQLLIIWMIWCVFLSLAEIWSVFISMKHCPRFLCRKVLWNVIHCFDQVIPEKSRNRKQIITSRYLITKAISHRKKSFLDHDIFWKS